MGEILEEIERADAYSQVDKLIGSVRSNGLGIAGVNPTRQALESGQVETLFLDPQTDNLDETTCEELIRLAAVSGAHVEMIENHDELVEIDGVGGLFRYKI